MFKHLYSVKVAALAVLTAAGLMLGAAGCSGGPAEEPAPPVHDTMGHPGEGVSQDAAVDPVCGMRVDRGDARYAYEYKGETYYFCMEQDLEEFKADPERFVEKYKGMAQDAR